MYTHNDTLGFSLKVVILHIHRRCHLKIKPRSKYSWSTAGGGFTAKRGIFGSVGKLETMMCVSYGRLEDHVFSGAATGDIFIWKDILLLKTVKAHDGPVFAMYALDKVWHLYQNSFSSSAF